VQVTNAGFANVERDHVGESHSNAILRVPVSRPGPPGDLHMRRLGVRFPRRRCFKLDRKARSAIKKGLVAVAEPPNNLAFFASTADQRPDTPPTRSVSSSPLMAGPLPRDMTASGRTGRYSRPTFFGQNDDHVSGLAGRRLS